ncbi:hypothetical protein Lal_00026831 [Lupinus albus]|nr:hypothetical protein Lal_00026831 [Lupinus albus]
MVSHVLKIDPTYPKQVREEEEELGTIVVGFSLKRAHSRSGEKIPHFQNFRSDPLAQVMDSRSSENLTGSTAPKYHFSPRRDNSRLGENPPRELSRLSKSGLAWVRVGSPGREGLNWKGEILGYTEGFSPERELARLGDKSDVLDLSRLVEFRSLQSMPYPEGRITSQIGNRLIYAERDYDKEELKAEFIHCCNFLTCIFNYLC